MRRMTIFYASGRRESINVTGTIKDAIRSSVKDGFLDLGTKFIIMSTVEKIEVTGS